MPAWVPNTPDLPDGFEPPSASLRPVAPSDSAEYQAAALKSAQAINGLGYSDLPSKIREIFRDMFDAADSILLTRSREDRYRAMMTAHRTLNGYF